jgi:microcystin-dependent protein
MIRQLIAAALLVSFAARAAEADAAPTEIAAPRSASPSNGVEQAPRRGTFAEASVGVLTAMGGSRTFSNAQPYLGVTFGRDIGAAAAIFASIGFGAASNSCFERSSRGDCLAADSFGATFIEAGGSYDVAIAPRLSWSLKATAGMTLFSPGPFTSAGGAVPDQLMAPHAGGGVGLEYATHDHFAVGVDTMMRYSLVSRATGGHSGIATLVILPRIRYVF